jgi:hypothetical protein
MKENKEIKAWSPDDEGPSKQVFHGQLTGKSRYRISFFGKVLLQLEYHVVIARKGRDHVSSYKIPEHKGLKWRDATQEDMKMQLGLAAAILEGIPQQLRA